MALIRKEYGRDYFENILHRESPDSSRNQSRLREILSRKQSGKLLEIGCGKGGFLRLANRHFDVEGIEISKYAKSSIDDYLGERVKQIDIEGECPLLCQYDVIVAFNVLEHLKQPGKVIEKIFHGLQNGGLVIGSVPHNAGAIGRVYTALTNLFDKTHSSTYPPNRWQALFVNAGFRNTQIFGEIILGRSIIQYVKNRLWRHLSFNMMFLCEK